MKKQPAKRDFLKKIKGASSMLLKTVALLISYVIVFAFLFMLVAPEKHDLRVGDIATETIESPQRIVDTYTTNLLKEEARNGVSKKYNQDDEITQQVLDNVQVSFEDIDTVRQMGSDEVTRLNNLRIQAAVTPTADPNQNSTDQPSEPTIASTVKPQPTISITDTKTLTSEFSQQFLAKCAEVLSGSYSNEDIIQLIAMDEEKLNSLEYVINNQVKAALNNGVMEDYLSDQIYRIQQELANPSVGFSPFEQKIGNMIVSTDLVANLIYDDVATEAARQEAEDNVEDVIIQEHKNIVIKGEEVTQAQYALLTELGLLSTEGSNVKLVLGLMLLAGILVSYLYGYLYNFAKDYFSQNKYILLLLLVIIFMMLAFWVAGNVDLHLAPIAAGGLLLSILTEKKHGLALNAFFTLLMGVATFGHADTSAWTTFSIVAAGMLSGSVGLFVIRKIGQRTSIMLSGLVVGMINAVVFYACDLISGVKANDILVHCAYGVGSGILASIICVGTLPMWEAIFKLVTPLKLLELSNPNQPLLKRLMMEAPGTYHHCILVGNMAEHAAEVIGAESLLVRAGAYYHDIGKLKRPYFFAENQIGIMNPHDKIQPDLSAQIILSHPADGVAIAKRYKLPDCIQDIILQHHGTTTASYFYNKAKEQAEDPSTVNLNDFRYKGPVPQSREAAILMLADVAEAAVRSLPNPTAQEIEKMIRSLVEARLNDGQLIDSGLTLRNIETIIHVFTNDLSGVFHSRVEYPKSITDGQKNDNTI